MSSVKITTVNASPKSDGTLSTLLTQFENYAAELGVQVTTINLVHTDIPFVTGELDLALTNPLPFQKALIESDGIVIATPTYWFNVPARLKNFIDNLTILEENGYLLEGKVGGIIVYAPQGGDTTVLASLMLPLNHMGVVFPPYSAIFYRGKQDTWVDQDIKDMAKRIIVQIDAQKKLSLKWDNWEA